MNIKETKEIKIYEYSEDRFIAKARKLLKIAKKARIEFDISLGDWESYRDNDGRVHKYFMARIPLIAPRIGNYSVIGHKEFVKVQSKVGFDKVHIFDERHDIGFNNYECGHCQSHRDRYQVFMLQNNDTQEYLQVGSTCLHNYTNQDSLKYFNNYIDFIDELEREERSPKQPNVFSVEYIIQLSAYLIDNLQGGVYRKTSHAESTKYLLIQALNSGEFDKDMFNSYEQEAKKAIEHFKTCNALSDYMNTCQNFATIGECREKDLGVVCSIISVYRSIVDRNKQQEEENMGKEFVGEVNTRVVFEDLEYLKTTSSIHTFGVTYFHTFEDRRGNIIINKSSKDLHEDFGWVDIGDILTFKATIKKHDDFRGLKATIVNRVAVVKELK